MISPGLNIYLIFTNFSAFCCGEVDTDWLFNIIDSEGNLLAYGGKINNFS
jgi:hypothetical protein